MLVWINGPFGVGKTQTAHELCRRLPSGVICDPEHLGFGLHRTMPAALREDFRDLSAWRDGTVEVLDLALTATPGTVIVPMTVLTPSHLDETVGRLRDRGHHVLHFTLMADRSTITRRLRARSFGRQEPFALSQLDGSLDRLRGREFAEHVATDHLTVAEVADRIAAAAGLQLGPNTDGRLRGHLRRLEVTARHIRFD